VLVNKRRIRMPQCVTAQFVIGDLL